eukprot:2461296-Pleurochrysis_carterae.AAC.1
MLGRGCSARTGSLFEGGVSATAKSNVLSDCLLSTLPFSCKKVERAAKEGHEEGMHLDGMLWGSRRAAGSNDNCRCEQHSLKAS